MNKVKVPPGWVRKQVNKKILYITDAPKTHIWKIGEFDKLKGKGRFPDVERESLNFSIKVNTFLFQQYKLVLNVLSC